MPISEAMNMRETHATRAASPMKREASVCPDLLPLGQLIMVKRSPSSCVDG